MTSGFEFEQEFGNEVLNLNSNKKLHSKVAFESLILETKVITNWETKEQHLWILYCNMRRVLAGAFMVSSLKIISLIISLFDLTNYNGWKNEKTDEKKKMV